MYAPSILAKLMQLALSCALAIYGATRLVTGPWWFQVVVMMSRVASQSRREPPCACEREQVLSAIADSRCRSTRSENLELVGVRCFK